MSSTVLQLQSIGIQDIYLTKEPQINIFKYTYYRYVNFAIETAKLPLNEFVNFNRRTTCDVLKRGHLLSKLYLHVRLPALTKNGGTYACWSNSLGYAIFSDPIELEIGGVIVDRLYPQFLDIWDEFSNSDKQLGRNLMINKSDVYVASYDNASKQVDLVIPLDFWFTKQYSSALPLLSMQNQTIKLNFKFRGFSELVHYDGSAPQEVDIMDANVYAEYVYLDDIILEQFQQQKHMYIVEQVQYHGEEVIPSGTTIYNTTLKFNHPIKELFFACVDMDNYNNNNYYVYSNADNNPIISEVSLLLDGKRRFEFLPEFYYRSIFPDAVHSVIPISYIYCMPFSIKPEDNQPTGSLNMSRFNDVVLSIKLPNNSSRCILYVYALNYNIAKVENGAFMMEFIT